MLLAALLALHDPVASFTATPLSGPPPLTVAVDASASVAAHGGIVSYAWDWGDGSTSSGVSSGHAYGATGTYVVRLTVVDGSGLSGSTERSIDVLSSGNVRPSASISSAAPSQGDAPLAVTFSGLGTDPGDVLEHRWDFGDGSPPAVFTGLASGASTSPAHTYAAPGTYTCRLRVVDAEGVIALAGVQIVVSAAGHPVAAFIVTPSGPPGSLFTADPSASFDPGGGALTYSWNWGDGTVTSTASHAYAATGTYTVRLTVTDVDGLQGEAEREVHCLSAGNVPPTADLRSAIPAAGVAPLTVTFVGHGHDDTGPLAHRWDFGEGGAPALFTGVANHENSRPTYVYQHPGTYTCALRVSDPENVSSTRSVVVTVAAADGPLGERCGATGWEALALLVLFARRHRGAWAVAALLAMSGLAEAQVTCTGCAERMLPQNSVGAGQTSARLAFLATGGDRAFSGSREALAPPPPADIEWTRVVAALDVYHQFTPKIGAGLILPAYDQRIDNRSTGVESDASGIGDLAFYAFWSPWKEEVEPPDFLSAQNLSFMLAMSVPTGDELDGEVPALHNYHLGSGSVEFKFLARYDGRLTEGLSLYAAGAMTVDGGADPSGFRYGNGYDGQLGLVTRPLPELRLLGAVNVVRREEDRLSGVDLPDSGGTWWYALAGAAVSLTKDVVLEATVALPFRYNVEGTQPVSDEVWTAGLTWRF